MWRMPFGKGPEGAFDSALSRPSVDAVVAAEHALDVAVQNRMPVAMAEREDCAGGGATDSGQGDESLEVARHHAAMKVPHHTGSAMEVACPRVVAESRP